MEKDVQSNTKLQYLILNHEIKECPYIFVQRPVDIKHTNFQVLSVQIMMTCLSCLNTKIKIFKIKLQTLIMLFVLAIERV